MGYQVEQATRSISLGSDNHAWTFVVRYNNDLRMPIWGVQFLPPSNQSYAGSRNTLTHVSRLKCSIRSIGIRIRQLTHKIGMNALDWPPLSGPGGMLVRNPRIISSLRVNT